MIRAALLCGPRSVELADVELRSPADGEVALRVEACGVCATNLRAWAAPNGESALPGAIGHEVVGVVTEVGPGVDGVEPGDRVCIDPVLAAACGACAPCLADRPWFCRDRRSPAVWGFADAMVVPAGSVFAADAVGSTASLAEPLACGVHAVRASWTAEQRGGRLDGVDLAVLGAGTTGLLALIAAREAGAERVVVVARHDHQAAAAERLGADEVLREADAPGRLRELRPELVVEAVGGRGEAFDLATRAVAPAGEVVVLGLFDDGRVLDVSRAPLREHHYVFPIAYGSVDFQLALELLAARARDLESLVTHTFPLSAVGEAFATAADKRSGALRVVVEPGDERA
jgi:2-desacetyl-2-hydroxyethyl bacteriochlorophyllide A dehydrogenase